MATFEAKAYPAAMSTTSLDTVPMLGEPFNEQNANISLKEVPAGALQHRSSQEESST